MVVLDISAGITAMVTIFAIVNPVGNVPFFVSVTDGFSPELKRRVVIKVCLVMIGVLFTFGIFGELIFSIYKITIPAFRVAGGALLFIVALAMVQGRPVSGQITESEADEAVEKTMVGIVPLGIPMFAGPGSITTVMILISNFQEGGEVSCYLFVFMGILLTAGITYIILSRSDIILRVMGRSGTMAFSRIMGLILAAVAVQFMLDGAFQAIAESGLL